MKAADKKQQVGEMFDNIAPTYDRLNHMLSLQIDRTWRRRTVRIAAKSHPKDILDVATGTGDLAISLARRIGEAQVTGADISENMLEIGRRKVSEKGLADRITLQMGDAEALDFPDGSFDCVTAAFGVRNFGDIPAGLREIWRVTRQGGECLVLEFSEPTIPLFAQVYRFYFRRILPLLGARVSKDGSAYSYLPESVGGFPAPDVFAGMLRDAGFTEVKKHMLTFGVAYIYIARK